MRDVVRRPNGVARRLPALGVAVALLAGVQLFPASLSATAAGSDVDLGAVSVTKTVTRSHLEADGSSTLVDSRTVSLEVSQTKGLRSRQPVRVSWSGAHPTGGIIGDPTGENARAQEYPFVLIECRGVEAADASAADQLRPETCWTGTMQERDAVDPQNAFGPWRLDRYETTANRGATPGVVMPLAKSCSTDYASQGRWVHFLSASGEDFATDGTGESALGRCGTAPAESVIVANASQPSNNQYAATAKDGTGFTKFTTWTAEDNASLGCGGTVACSLVAVPIMGISCDETAQGLSSADVPPATARPGLKKTCRATGSFVPGSLRSGGSQARAVSGELWWSESNWRNRITVPLSFAPLSNVCDITSGKDSVDIYGSELLTSLTSLWRPAFCLSETAVPFKHVQLSEPQAANLLRGGSVEAAFVARPPDGGFGADTAVAPVALTGFSISYTVDGSDQQPYHNLRLTPRLLAKLLTASYPGLLSIKIEHEALSRNPLDLTSDPEFQALNPGIPVLGSVAASTLVNLSSDSDVVYALTSYLNADPEAHDFLYGVPDPWGAVVNPAYRRIPLPTNNWPLLDDFQPLKSYATGANVCLQVNPVPIVPLIQSPTSRLGTIAGTVQFAVSTSQLTCNTIDGAEAKGAKLVGLGRQPPGRRFVVGLTSLADAARYDLDSAALQTTVAADAVERFSDGRGRSFASPTKAGLRSAADRLVVDSSIGTWSYPYASTGTDAQAGAAYPGTMLVSMAVPTKGLPPADAQGFADVLEYAAGPGQRPGLDAGELPPGYLPLTVANGLARQREQLLRAVSAVRAQSGGAVSPLAIATPVDTAVPSPLPAPVKVDVPNNSPTPQSPPLVAPGLAPAPVPGQVAVPGTRSAPVPAATALPAPVTVDLAATPRATSMVSASLFPLLLSLAVVLGVASGLLGRRPRARP